MYADSRNKAAQGSSQARPRPAPRCQGRASCLARSESDCVGGKTLNPSWQCQHAARLVMPVPPSWCRWSSLHLLPVAACGQGSREGGREGGRVGGRAGWRGACGGGERVGGAADKRALARARPGVAGRGPDAAPPGQRQNVIPRGRRDAQLTAEWRRRRADLDGSRGAARAAGRSSGLCRWWLGADGQPRVCCRRPPEGRVGLGREGGEHVGMHVCGGEERGVVGRSGHAGRAPGGAARGGRGQRQEQASPCRPGRKLTAGWRCRRRKKSA